MEDMDGHILTEDWQKLMNYLDPNDPSAQPAFYNQVPPTFQQYGMQPGMQQGMQPVKVEQGFPQQFPPGAMPNMYGQQYPMHGQDVAQLQEWGQPSQQMYMQQPQVQHMPQSVAQPARVDAPRQVIPVASSPSEDGDSPSQLLEQITQIIREQKDRLEKVRLYQKQVMMNPQKDSFDMLNQEHQSFKEHLDNEIRALQQVSQRVILAPGEINRLLGLLQELKIQQTQLELYHQELIQLTQSYPTRCIATLVIAEQPFPMVVTKLKQLDDDPVVVQLLSGANVELQSFSKMKVVMIWENHQAKTNTQKMIECDTQPIDAFRRQVKWNLKFLNGTRKNSVTLRFGIQVQVVQGSSSASVTVESNSSQPFIVITNECQWEESEGTLLRRDAFGDQQEVTWPYFANMLQRHFLRATRQDPIRPTRCLCQTDFEYIHQKFFDSAPMITLKAYDEFWSWFGKTVKKLRYQRHILPLWQTGLIHGFLSREAVQEILLNEENGTFLVRFSERHPGLFAVGYRIDDEARPEERVRHYLIRPEDTAGTKKTLPDFLSEQGTFNVLLAVATNDDEGGAEAGPYRHYQKDRVLEPYYSKRSTVPPLTGYDDAIIRGSCSGGYDELEMDTDIMGAE